MIVVLLTRPATPILQRALVSELGVGGADMMKTSIMGLPSPVFSESTPVTQPDRLVVTNTNLSMKVNDVRTAIDEISAVAVKSGGFMVESSLSVPEGAASGWVSVRIPSSNLTEGLATIRSFGVKVISENVIGTDVTSEYVDIGARLATLQKTKVKFEEILTSATGVTDLLSVQRELIGLQSQIDSLRGQQRYLEQTAKLSLVTAYLATDELALPYTPDEAWRPVVIFREAVRSLVRSARGLGTALVWAVVYSPVWLPIFLLAWWLKRRANGG